MFKILMNQYNATPQELLYYVSFLCASGFYVFVRSKNMDLLNIEPSKRGYLAARILFGCLNDILLFMAFYYVSYSKAICTFYTNTLMIPFFGKWILNEQVYKADYAAIVVGFVGMLLIVQPFN